MTAQMLSFINSKQEVSLNSFHCPIKICKRSLGCSAVAASAYINRTRLENTWDGIVRDYTRKGGLVIPG